MVKRGEIWLVRLDPTVGSEIRKTRPCLIVSPDIFSHLSTYVIAPMTTGSHPARFRVPITFQGRSGLVLVDQLRTVDRSRLIRWVGDADKKILADTLAKIREAFEE